MLSQTNSTQIPLRSNSVHCCVTSPPYFALRSYLSDNDPLKAHEIGNEPTPEAYIANLVAVGREIWRVLRDDGTWWLNLGDSYAGGASRGDSSFGSTKQSTSKGTHFLQGKSIAVPDGLKSKDIMLIPARVALALQADGWYIRAACPWVKASGMPESCKDRPNVAHETVFLLSKSPRYFFDMDAVRVGQSPDSIARQKRGVSANHKNTNGAPGQPPHTFSQYRPNDPSREVESGRHWRTSDIFNAGLDDALLTLEAQKERLEAEIAALKYARDNGGLAAYCDDPLAFLVNTKPYKGAHYAVFPPGLVVPMIKASTSPKVCGSCGAPWVRVTEKVKWGQSESQSMFPENSNAKNLSLSRQYYRKQYGTEGPPPPTTLGFSPTCSCGAPTMPAIVLDCFAGSGTVGAACRELGREFIGLELNARYISENAMARSERTTSAAVMAQMPLFAGMETK